MCPRARPSSFALALVVAILLAVFVLPRSWGIVAVAGAIVLEVAEAGFWWRLSRRRKPQVGLEAMVGLRAVVASACRPRGRVRVRGELWQARCDAGADAGEAVIVRAVDTDGLSLVVEPERR